MNGSWLTIPGIVIPGHQVASKKSEHYPRGTIQMQIPYFKARGLDLTSFRAATLNVSVAPYVLSMKSPAYTFRGVTWTSRHPPEDFSFSLCHVVYEGVKYVSWIYYPHPETKERHWQDPSTVEIIAPFIPGIQYGDRLEVELNLTEVSVIVDAS